MLTLSLPSAASPISISLKPSASTLSQTNPSSRSFKTPNLDYLRTHLIHQANVGRLNDAISTLSLLSSHGAFPDLSTFSQLLKSSIRTRNFHLGMLVHAKIVESRLEPDSLLSNSLITLYSKSGEWETASEIFYAMGDKRGLGSWSAMISCFANNGFACKAIETFVEMTRDSGFDPNEFCYGAVIRACCDLGNAGIGNMVLGRLIKGRYFDYACVKCALIDMFAKGFGDMGSARKVFDRMTERDVVSWTLMLTRLAQMGFPEDAVDLFLEMELSGCQPDHFTLTSILSACADLELISLGKQLHSRVIKYGWESDDSTGCSLVGVYAKCVSHGSLPYARKAFDRIADPNVMSWTAMLTAYAQSGAHQEEALELFIDMIEAPVSPNRLTIACVLKACGNLSHPCTGEQVYGQAVKLGLASDDCVGNSLISMYSQSGRMDNAQKAFDILLEKNIVSYNTIIDGYGRSANSSIAFELFNQMESGGMRGDAFTFSSLLSTAAGVGAGGKGEVFHARAVKAGFDSSAPVSNALISMYSRCGDIEAAHRVFAEMGELVNVVSWTCLITGYAKHGLARRALETFDRMVEAGIKPNEITFVAVLSACSHAGLVPEGKRHFESMMHGKYGILPVMDHYACMVDLLGRSGLLEEALAFISGMPLQANALVWRTLLGACLVHGNTSIGERAAQMAIDQDHSDPSAYTLLSNLYASKGQWRDVLKTREEMKKKKLRKETGCSWIEVGSIVHRFYVGDTSHPQAREIYRELDSLVSRIKEMGYVPNTDFVLHEMEEERKEMYLIQHSEKIAVAFGLISTPSSKPIRIFKNMRICGDCHCALRYVSKATGREIVVRDMNRFHRFSDGLCSCNEYW